MTRTYVIAEAGVNHDGSEKRAFELIDIAADSGADAVKFQLFNPEKLVTGAAPTAEYQARNVKGARSQRQMLDLLTLSPQVMGNLSQHCTLRNIDFLCTPFDHDSLDYLIAHTAMPYLKLASGEVANGPLLLASARSGLPVILSTGMSDLEEICTALSILHFGYTREGFPRGAVTLTPLMMKQLRGKVVLLHCVSQYPAPAHSMNLRAIDTMAETFGLPVGLSDHSLGIALAIAAVARGAVVIEKHFTYDNKAKGPDHAASLTPDALKAMIDGIRDVEAGLGDGQKHCQPEEIDTRNVARRSVVAAGPIARGELFSKENLICKRPASGLVPNHLWDLLGKPARRDYAADDFIDKEELDS